MPSVPEAATPDTAEELFHGVVQQVNANGLILCSTDSDSLPGAVQPAAVYPVTMDVPREQSTNVSASTYARGIAVVHKLCAADNSVETAIDAVVERIFSMDVGVQVGRAVGGKKRQLSSTEVADRIRVSLHLFQYTRYDDALRQACLMPLLRQQATAN